MQPCDDEPLLLCPPPLCKALHPGCTPRLSSLIAHANRAGPDRVVSCRVVSCRRVQLGCYHRARPRTPRHTIIVQYAYLVVESLDTYAYDIVVAIPPACWYLGI